MRTRCAALARLAIVSTATVGCSRGKLIRSKCSHSKYRRSKCSHGPRRAAHAGQGHRAHHGTPCNRMPCRPCPQRMQAATRMPRGRYATRFALVTRSARYTRTSTTCSWRSTPTSCFPSMEMTCSRRTLSTAARRLGHTSTVWAPRPTAGFSKRRVRASSSPESRAQARRRLPNASYST